MSKPTHWMVEGLLNKFMPRLAYFFEKTKSIGTLDYQTHLGNISNHRK